MRKIEPAPELNGWDFIAAGIVLLGILLVMILVGIMTDSGMIEAGELDEAETRVSAGEVE